MCHCGKLFDYYETSVTDDPNSSASGSPREFVVVVARTCKPNVESFLRRGVTSAPIHMDIRRSSTMETMQVFFVAENILGTTAYFSRPQGIR